MGDTQVITCPGPGFSEEESEGLKGRALLIKSSSKGSGRGKPKSGTLVKGSINRVTDCEAINIAPGGIASGEKRQKICSTQGAMLFGKGQKVVSTYKCGPRETKCGVSPIKKP